MKLYLITVKEEDWDCVKSAVVLAKDENQAQDIAIKNNCYFENNIKSIEEIDTNKPLYVHEHIIYG